MNYLSVRDVSLRLGKNEETIKRWIRSGKLPGKKNSDREGWLILESDLQAMNSKNNNSVPPLVEQQTDEVELIALAFQGVTLLQPTEEILEALSEVGIKWALEILLVMRQSPKPVRNPLGFIRNCIQKGWTPDTIPVPITRKRAVKNNGAVRKEMVPDWLTKPQDVLVQQTVSPDLEEQRKQLEEALKKYKKSDGTS